MAKKVLIVDDEEVIRDMLDKAFSDLGYEVRCAGSGEQALNMLKGEKLQVMFLDLKLPDMDGLELCKEIREDSPAACIFALTGYSSIFEVVECRKAGFDDYFTKPVKLELLFQAAQDAYGKLDRWKGK